MKKYYIWGIVITIIVIIGVIFGVVMFNNDNPDNQTQNKEINFIKENKTTENLTNTIEIITTVSEEEKTSPNCLFIFKTYYKQCEHTKTEREIITETMVNKTKEDLRDIYTNWNIIKFTKNEVIFGKDEEGECGEHYILKDEEGKIVIYTIDENEKLTLKEKTEILTAYLPEQDLEKLKQGIRVNGKEELNQTLEDYE